MEKAVQKAAVNREVNNCVYNWTSDRITGRFATANEVKSVTSHEVINSYATSPTYVDTIMSIIRTYNLTQFDDTTTKKTDMPEGHNPYTEPTQNVRRGTRGEGARWVQWCLWRFGLLGESEIDGIIGAKSEAAVRTAQIRLGLTIDGIVGKKTRQAFINVLTGKQD